MRIHLLTALVLASVPTGMQAQNALAAQASPAAGTTSAQSGNWIESAPEDPNASYNTTTQYYQTLPNLYSQDSGGGAEAVGPLIVFDQHDPKAMDEMAEDFNIFGFIIKRNLEKALGEQMPEIKMGVPMLLESGGR